MDIALFTDKAGVEKQFDSVRRSRNFTVSRFPFAEWRKTVKTLPGGTLVYIDIGGLDDEQRVKLLRYLARMKDLRYGIIDVERKIKDVASLFHAGASDYLDRALLREKIPASRLTKAMLLRDIGPDLKDHVRSGPASASRGFVNGQAVIPTSHDWSNVRAGSEYTFGMMYVELDDQSSFKNKLHDDQINALLATFKRYIERSMAPLNGRIWIWNDYSGLMLFPFDGKRSDVPVACLRLMLSKKIFSVEETSFDSLLSYRIAFHIGNTVYRKKGNTGTIVSTSINTIYHLGQKYLHPGQFYITEDALHFAPDGLKDCFVPVGNYEGHHIFRMKLPL